MRILAPSPKALIIRMRQVFMLTELEKSRLLFAIEKANVLPTFPLAIKRMRQYLSQEEPEKIR